jgi:hypothetical protein
MRPSSGDPLSAHRDPGGPVTEPLRYLLTEDQMPTTWYNIIADLPQPPPPPLHPGTIEPVGPDDLAPLFPMDLIDAGGHHRALHRDPRRGPGRLPAVAPTPLHPGAPPGEGARHPGADLLQVRGRLEPRRLAQAEHRRAAGLLQRQGRRQEADHRDRRRPVGHRAGLRVPDVRHGVRGLAGPRELRPEAVPPGDDARRSARPSTRRRRM